MLFLNFTGVTDAGMEHLKNLGELQTLYIGATHVTDAGLKYLENLTHN